MISFRRWKAWLNRLTPLNLETIVESLSDAVMVIEKDNRIRFHNAHWTTLTGLSSTPTKRLNFTDFFHPEDRIHWQTTLQTVEQTLTTQLLWLRIIDAQDDVHWCEVRVQPLYPNQAFPVSATLCDITPQIRSDQIKEARYRSLQCLMDRVPAMIYRSRNNIHWTMEYVSKGCLELTGYEPEQMLNNAELSYGSLIHADDQETVWVEVQKAIQAKQSFELTYRLVHANGEMRQVYEKGCAIYSETGAVLGVEGVIFSFDALNKLTKPA